MTATPAITPSTGAAFARILGVGGYRPVRVIPNAEVLNWIDSSDEWIRTRSGITERRWAGPEETVAEMSVQAASKAIAQAGVAPEQIGAVIVATVSHLKQTPAIATEIAQRLGCGTAPAFDMRSPEIPPGRRTTRARNMRAQKRNLRAKRNRAIREKLAK